MVALEACVPPESGAPFPQLLASVARAGVAVALGAFAVAWILQRLPADAPEFDRAPRSASAPAAPAQTTAAVPRGALFDPAYLAGSPQSFAAPAAGAAPGLQPSPLTLAAAIPPLEIPAPTAKRAAAGGNLPHVPPVVTAALPAAAEAAPEPKPSLLPSGETAPLPPRRVETAHVAPAAPAAPFDRVERTGRGAPVVAETPPANRNFVERLSGAARLTGRTLASASPESGFSNVARTAAFGALARYDHWTAIYDLAAHTVYMPDGTRLEAHSGLGDRLDDPAHVNERARGATPPHLYELAPRPELFHGVEALRLNPVGAGDIFGRAGFLAHTYMLGPNGDSNGCVSFKNYDAFLQAFRNGQVRRLAVVARLN